MLVLTIRCEQTLVVGDNFVRFKILSVHGRQVRIGVMADKSVPIHREEIYRKIINPATK